PFAHNTPASIAAAASKLHNCVSDGHCYTPADGTTGVAYGPVNQTITFVLDAVTTGGGGDRIVVATVETTVQVVTPSISQLSYLTPLFNGAVVRLHWLAFNAGYCAVTVNGVTYDSNAPTDTYVNG